jgi:signal transduction histidine kinase/ActR/RegA family two-component response regulator
MSSWHPRHAAWLRYTVAVAIVALATLLRFWLEEPLAGGGFMILFVAVIIASWFGGLGPSIVALVLSVVLSAWFFSPPPDAPPEPVARGVAGLVIFFFTGLTTAILSESLRAARRRAELADRRKDEFLAILAHELRNPLAPIRMTLEILKQPGVDDATHRWAHEVMERQVRQLVRLVDDLLDVSRIARDKIELRNETIDLQTVVERAVETSRGSIESKSHHLTVALPGEVVQLFVDPVRLSQVIANLLNNAAKYTPSGGQIWLEVVMAGQTVEIRVRDTGIGIAREMLSDVFDLFRQAPSSQGGQGGLGIGLTLVKRLTELMGGSVEAHSAGLGHGSEFVVRLPLECGEQKPVAQRQTLAQAPPADFKRRIFVIDDNVDAAQTLTELLRLEGHEVSTFHDARAALAAVESAAPEVVLLDLGMPEMDGFELARRLRELPATAHSLLIAVTGWGQPADRARSSAAGINHHLVKPVDADTLRQLVHQVSEAGSVAVPTA